MTLCNICHYGPLSAFFRALSAIWCHAGVHLLPQGHALVVVAEGAEKTIMVVFNRLLIGFYQIVFEPCDCAKVVILETGGHQMENTEEWWR